MTFWRGALGQAALPGMLNAEGSAKSPLGLLVKVSQPTV